MVIVNDNKDWIITIEKLINNKEERRQLGRLAKEYVVKNYNIEDKAHLWEEAYSKI
jgi:spore maturation protein CgeB